MADLTVELRAWPTDTWAKFGVDPDQVAQAVVGCWQDGEVTGLQFDDLHDATCSVFWSDFFRTFQILLSTM